MDAVYPRNLETFARCFTADWTAAELAIGEICLYRAFAVRFPRKTDGLPDKSLFVVPEDADLAALLAEARADFEAVERLR